MCWRRAHAPIAHVSHSAVCVCVWNHDIDILWYSDVLHYFIETLKHKHNITQSWRTRWKKSTDMDSVVLESEKKNVAEKHTSWNKRYSPFVKYLILNIVWYYSMHITAWELSEERKKSCILCGDVIRVAYANRARCTKKIEHSKPLLGPAREHISSTETITLGKCSEQCF